MDYGSEGRAHKAGTVIDERLDSGLDSLREEDYCSAREESVTAEFERLSVDAAQEESWRTETTEDGDTCVVTIITVIIVRGHLNCLCTFNTRLRDTVRVHSRINTSSVQIMWNYGSRC